jgi:hypothetical protein
MAKQDWIQVIKYFNQKDLDYIEKFLSSEEVFLPNQNSINIFSEFDSVFSAKQLEKAKPGNWIPIYKEEDLSNYLIENNLMPIRCGQAEFFFYKGNIFFDLKKIIFIDIEIKNIHRIEDFFPLTLENFHKNENAYLNKALSLGIINNFLDSELLKVFKKEIQNKNYRRLLYGQFGKIKTNFELEFKTKKGTKTINNGFQFEIDLVLENKNEIIIFEAKQGIKRRTSFCLLQLYYPLIYLIKITNNKKKIRTIFIDIETKNSEEYMLIEYEFKNLNFDDYKVLKAVKYNSLK